MDTDGQRKPEADGHTAAHRHTLGGVGPAAHAEGGESACQLARVCSACGRLADTAPPTVCPRCGAPVGTDED